MQVTIVTALNKAATFVGASMSKVAGLTKPRIKFFLWLLEGWWLLAVRYNFLNLSRYGGYSEKAIRKQQEKKPPLVSMFDTLYSSLNKKECILAFAPTFITKSGKQPPHLNWFWNGCHQRSEKGLEAGVPAIIEAEAATACHLAAVQTEAPLKGRETDRDKRMAQNARMLT